MIKLHLKERKTYLPNIAQQVGLGLYLQILWVPSIPLIPPSSLLWRESSRQPCSPTAPQAQQPAMRWYPTAEQNFDEKFVNFTIMYKLEFCLSVLLIFDIFDSILHFHLFIAHFAWSWLTWFSNSIGVHLWQHLQIAFTNKFEIINCAAMKSCALSTFKLENGKRFVRREQKIKSAYKEAESQLPHWMNFVTEHWTFLTLSPRTFYAGNIHTIPISQPSITLFQKQRLPAQQWGPQQLFWNKTINLTIMTTETRGKPDRRGDIGGCLRES